MTQGIATMDYADLIHALYFENASLLNETLPVDDANLYYVPVGLIVLLAFLYGSISLIAVIGNGLVIFVIVKDKRMQTVTNIFIANLAFADVIIGMLATPFQFQPALHQRWDLPDFLCQLAPSVKILSVSVSVLTLTVISVDRYVAVLYPLTAGFSKRRSIIVLAIIWLVGIVSSFPEGYFYKVAPLYDPNLRDFKPFCSPAYPSVQFGTIYQLYLLIVQYLLPLSVINFSYSRIACRIWGTKAPGYVVDRENVRQRNKRKVVKMLIIVVCLFVLCWMPLQTYKLLSVVHAEINEYKYINIIWFCSNWLAMSNSCYNPFIYGLLNEKFKREYRLLFSKMTCLKRRSSLRQNGTHENSLDSNDGSKRIRMSYRNNNFRQLPSKKGNGIHPRRYRLVLGTSNDSIEATSNTNV